MRILRTFFREFTTQSKTAWGWSKNNVKGLKERKMHLTSWHLATTLGSNYPTYNPWMVSWTCTPSVGPRVMLQL